MKSVFVAVMVIALKCLSEVEGAIRCYKCSLAPSVYYTNETIRLCQHFDYSDKFIVDCPYSTYCMKKFFSAKLPVTINGTERDCASQRLDTQNYKNGQWRPEVVVEEPYEEGCATEDDKGLKTSHTENCYCRGDLCNSGRGAVLDRAAFWAVTLSSVVARFRF